MADTTVCAEPPRGASSKLEDASSADDVLFPQAAVATIPNAAITSPVFCDTRM
jgi:hypothetical protein